MAAAMCPLLACVELRDACCCDREALEPGKPGCTLPPVVLLPPCVDPGKLVDVMAPEGVTAITPGGGSTPGGLFDATGMGMKTTDWFAGAGGDCGVDGWPPEGD
ncbi:hypothetical protein E2562_016483 [Oryza meyeriana var. granulata]|uniref:Uncharacterized protein n=1 Tax=Oryza meyeriana var. granulata TaxID=110450 RepID=A0A6G1BLT8_9ORYZ|nr:hypothetical protein E2562_016483 [Oryza meyeriana var. granulata]